MKITLSTALEQIRGVEEIGNDNYNDDDADFVPLEV